MKKVFFYILILLISLVAVAQDDNTRQAATRRPGTSVPVTNTGGKPAMAGRQAPEKAPKGADEKKEKVEKKKVLMNELILEDEIIPDSLLNPRWKVQKTSPLNNDDLKKGTADLAFPENIKQEAEYKDTLGYYVIGSKIGGGYVNAPIFMTPEEYQKWTLKKSMQEYWKKKAAEEFSSGGKEKFDFTDMHFSLGPAEKIFGPGGVRIKTQGTAEIKFGANVKKIDNPSLPIKNRKTTALDFNEKINLSLNGSVGDKMKMNLNYNTDATFDFDTQNLKLKYDGKEDEIIKLLEAGNVSFPSNNSLVQGASALFGIRTDLQFGKLKLQTVVSQKKSNSKSVQSQGGTQLTTFELDAADYEENRHFFLSRYFRDQYDGAMAKLPNIATGITLTRVEIWVTNKTGTTSNSRNLVALPDLGENTVVTNSKWAINHWPVPANGANTVYSEMTHTYNSARAIDQVSTVMAEFESGVDYEKLENARLLSSSEYTINQALGYVSLKSALQTDQVLGIAYEYTCNGQTYQVGEFSTDNTDASQCLYVKSLKNSSNSPMYDRSGAIKYSRGTWEYMMKNVYYLAANIEKEKFRLDIKYQSDTAGVYITYLPDQRTKNTTLLKLLNCDRLDNNNKAHSNGYFDYVQGYTVNNGRVYFPAAEPFGSFLKNQLVTKYAFKESEAEKYVYQELYDTLKTIAKQVAEKDKYVFMGQFKGTRANVISLGAFNVPQGSVTVTAGGVTLTENSDYTVDYSAGEVTIINQSLIDAGTNINVSLESNTDYGQQRKTMVGLNFEYDFSKNFQIGGTIMHLSEQSLTSKVAMGAEPLKNTIWGLNVNWKSESQWLTNMLDKVPFLHVTQPSQISLNAEFAQLIAGTASGTQDNASYLDDFENAKNCIDISTPSSWILASVPRLEDKSNPYYNSCDIKNSVESGYGRALMSWYYVDPLFTRRSSSLTPAHIKNDLDQLSNHYVREVYVHELFPNRDLSSYSGSTATLNVMNIAYYPNERGPYNFSPQLNFDGSLKTPKNRWGGMMRKLETSDFETSNIEYIEFWMMDPFIYTNRDGTAREHTGKMYIDLGEISEDILKDGQKFMESGMPVDGRDIFTTTAWGKIPHPATTTYAFATTSGSRLLQDVGYNGLNDTEELDFDGYRQNLAEMQAAVSDSVWQIIQADPANDNYHYFRGRDFDEAEASILERYKRINNPQGNSPDSENQTEGYDTSYKTSPDVEDINQDYTLNETEKYYRYKVDIDPNKMTTGSDNFIVDKRTTTATLRNGTSDEVTWYQFRIPVSQFTSKEGGINDFSSIRFMRVFLTDFEKPIVLRFGTFDLVRGEWRTYKQNLSSGAQSGTIEVSAVSIEENNDKQPVNYVLPPGISRVVDPSQPQLTQNNEQALDIIVRNLSKGEAKGVYKNTTLDLRNYKRLQMFVHANDLDPNTTQLKDNQLSVFVRLGSDYKSNYYEYDIPLTRTPAGTYSTYSAEDCRKVWPEANMLDVPLSKFTDLKKQRNIAKSSNPPTASFNAVFSQYDEDNPQNKISVIGNPTLGEVKTMVIGVRNNATEQKSGEVWVNELRLLESNNEGGWAAQGTLNIQLSDFGSVNLAGKVETEGFGGLEQGISERSTDNYRRYDVTTNFELGKFFPDKAKVSIPVYYSITKETTKPKYNPLDTDMKLKDALESLDKHEKDSVENITVTNVTNRSIAISNAKVDIRTKAHPMPYDPGNFSISYSHSHKYSTGQTTMYEREDNWKGSLNYSYTPVYKTFEPFKKIIKSNSKWLNIIKEFGLNYLPQNISFNTDMSRNSFELQERDMENLNEKLPLTFSSQFLWNRQFSLRWDILKTLHMNFQSATNAEIVEPYTLNDKALYIDDREAWKDSIWQSIKHWGTPLTYNQSFQASYQLPLNKIPIFEWINSDASYSATYSWNRGTEQEDGSTLGNTIVNNRTININGSLSFEKLYNLIPFLEGVNKRFSGSNNKTKTKTKTKTKAAANQKSTAKNQKKQTTKQATDQTTKPSKSFVKELKLFPDSTIEVTHGKKSKRLNVIAKTKDGKEYKLKFKVVDDNKIKVTAKDSIDIKLTVTPKTPLEDQTWYKVAQCASRVLMMVRSANISYRNNYSMSLPGFLPSIGKAFGQRTGGGLMSPGLDFAFGFIDDSYIDKALDNHWLLVSDSVATPAATSNTDDIQLKVTLEPVRDFKIDLNASRTMTRQKSIQYMYDHKPTTHGGTFTMTTISIGSAFEGMGNANNGYHSSTFEKFCSKLDEFRDRVEAQYHGAVYPEGTAFAGKTFDPANGAVDKYSGDVMIPAFLSAYCGGGESLDIFPALTRLLPNWTFRYSGLSKLSWFSDKFKSVNLNHSYKSIYAVGSYNSFSSFMEYMNGIGFVTGTAEDQLLPSSMYNVSTVSINEAFSPLLGIDVTLQNNMTLKAEYKTTRVVNLSMTSVQINETLSKDWVFGLGYKINDFNIFGYGKSKKVRTPNKKGKNNQEETETKTSTKSRTKSNVMNHELNLRCDFSLRNQAAITRSIKTLESTASSGNKALKIAFSADYTMSKLLTMSAFLDIQRNTPLMSSNSYPTSTYDFGVSMKFSLTR